MVMAKYDVNFLSIFLEDGNCSQLVKGELCKTTSNGAQELAAISASRDWTYLLYCLFLRQQLQGKGGAQTEKNSILKLSLHYPKYQDLSQSKTLCALEVAPFLGGGGYLFTSDCLDRQVDHIHSMPIQTLFKGICMLSKFIGLYFRICWHCSICICKLSFC